jgi:F-type H+-transporting ATPase subunit delta
MVESRAAARYARALLSVSEETGQLEAVSQDVAVLQDLIENSREFFLFLKSPVVNTATKKRILAQLLEKKLGKAAFNFVNLLAAKGRESLLPQILIQFARLRDEKLGLIDVLVRSPRPLDADQSQNIARRLSRQTNKDVRLKERVEPELIGGIVLQFDDTVWDGSVKRQLELLRIRLSGSAV